MSVYYKFVYYMNLNINNLINEINKIDRVTFDKINASFPIVKINNFKLIFIGKGVDGNVYAIDKYAVKFYKTNSYELVNNGNEKEIFILEETSKLVNKNITNNFLKLYGKTSIFNQTVIIMDLVNGDLENWAEIHHTNDEWLSMIFQILYATHVMQSYLKIYHHDMKPKNLLFKKMDKAITIKYVINYENKEYEFVINTDTIFIISDFGQASTLLFKTNAFIPETIKLAIENNLDLESLGAFHKKLIILAIKNMYRLKDIIEMGKKDKNFQSYYDIHRKKNELKLKGRPRQIFESIMFKVLAYYVIEKKLINISNIPDAKKRNLPTKEIQNILESLSELRGKDTLLNKIIEIGNMINVQNPKIDIELKSKL